MNNTNNDNVSNNINTIVFNLDSLNNSIDPNTISNNFMLSNYTNDLSDSNSNNSSDNLIRPNLIGNFILSYLNPIKS